MPTIPLYTPAVTPLGSHGVTAPGGYEWWRFDAEDAASDLRLLADFFDGHPFHPGYLRAYAHYRRWPTRIAPPLPRDYRCVRFALYRAGKIVARFQSRHDPAEFSASPAATEISIGSNHILAQPDGSLHVSLRGVTRAMQQVSAQLQFRPRPNIPVSAEQRIGHQHWVVAQPLCDVEGTVNVFSPSAPATPEVTMFQGVGGHDHSFGTRPFGDDAARWMFGRVLMADRAVPFHIAWPSDEAAQPEVRLIDTTSAVETPHIECIGWRSTPRLLRYPLHVKFGDRIQLRNPQLIESATVSASVVYDATVDTSTGPARCELVSPQRLRWKWRSTVS